MAAFTEIWRACSRDEFRPAINFAIITKDGEIVATNGHIIAVLHLKEIVGLYDIEDAQNKIIHRNNLKRMAKKSITTIIFTDKEVIMWDKADKEVDRFEYDGYYEDAEYSKPMTITNKDLIKDIDPNDLKNLKFPCWQGVFRGGESGKYKRLSVNAGFLLDLEKSLSVDGRSLAMNMPPNLADMPSPMEGILVRPVIMGTEPQRKSYGLLMPVNID